jgi:cytochrome c biogenesis protein CcdA
MGIEHGAFCVGCCWVLMVLLFVGGIMNVLWIAVLATVVLLEKLAPNGPWFARVTGIILLAWGARTSAGLRKRNVQIHFSGDRNSWAALRRNPQAKSQFQLFS